MKKKYIVPINHLKNTCNLDFINFNTTKDLIPLDHEIIGQTRASEAIEFGLIMKNKGYNIFVAGESGTGRNSYIKHITKEYSKKLPTPKDWVYVYNFHNPYIPISIPLDAGSGKEFVKNIHKIIETLKKEIPKIFVSKEYQRNKNIISQEYENHINKTINELNRIAKPLNFIFISSEDGISSIPLKNNNPMTQEDMNNLTTEEIDYIKLQSDKLSIETADIFAELNNKDTHIKLKFKELDKSSVLKLINLYVDPLKNTYKASPKILLFLNSYIKDILKNISIFKNQSEIENPEEFFIRYKVNLFLDNSNLNHGPVINETNPTHSNLLGFIEYTKDMGIMKTNFMQIKPGALHEANGGYLILQGKDILSNSVTWQSFKRMLLNEECVIGDLNNQLNHMVSTTLKPEPIPLDVKIIIIGNHHMYNYLYSYDEDFRKLFKIMADYDTSMKRNNDNALKMAQFISAHCEQKNLNHFSKEAVEKIIEHSSKIADHKEKLSTRFNAIIEILYESSTWSKLDNKSIVEKSHVKKAIEKRIYRNGIYEEKILEMFESENILLDIDGYKVGEINGLAVVSAGQYAFGKPSKITASTYRGADGIINIEREVKSSGRIHDKGVMIISGYLGQKYAQENALAISASIVFEQLYSGVDGDSASSTELYAILSSISKVPINQGLAVTGSVNQRGMIQPIGGVNEKIEGFYKICKIKGLTGDQGVIIPYQNVKNLMLSDEIINACKDNMFSIYSIKTIDEGIEILTNKKVGTIDETGNYDKDSIHYIVKENLNKFAEMKKAEN